jgi:hypothetical protein
LKGIKGARKATHTVAVGNGAAGSKVITQLNMHKRLCGELKGRRDMVAFLGGFSFVRQVCLSGSFIGFS